MNKARSENSEESSFEANWGSKLSLSVFQKLGIGMIGRKSQTTFVHLYLMLCKYIYHDICHDGRRHVLAHWRKKHLCFVGENKFETFFNALRDKIYRTQGPGYAIISKRPAARVSFAMLIPLSPCLWNSPDPLSMVPGVHTRENVPSFWALSRDLR